MKTTFPTIICILLFFFPSVHQAQSVKRWSIQECIEYAIANNYQLAQNTLNVSQSEQTLLQTKAGALPT